MTKDKYILNKGHNLTLKSGIVEPGYVFGMEEIDGVIKEEIIDTLLKRRVINKMKPKPEPEPKTKTNRAKGKGKRK